MDLPVVEIAAAKQLSHYRTKLHLHMFHLRTRKKEPQIENEQDRKKS